MFPDPYNLVEKFYSLDKEIAAVSAEIPWEKKDFKLFFRGQNVHTTWDIGDDCVIDAYNGRNPRLGAVIEGVNHRDFVDARFCSTFI